MKRVNTRGIKLANKCMLMAAIAYMMKFKTTRPMANMRQLTKLVDDFFISLKFSLQILPAGTFQKEK